MSDLRLTAAELRNILITKWIRPVLTAGGYLNIPVIAENGNAPAPARPYISISYNAIITKVGRASLSDIIITNEGELNETIERYVIQDNDLTGIDIKGYGDEGDMTNLLCDSLEYPSILQIFQNDKLAVVGKSNVTPQPTLFNDNWDRDSMFELRLRRTSVYVEVPNYIENVEFSGTVEN